MRSLKIYSNIDKRSFSRYIIFQILLFIIHGLANALSLSFSLADMQQAQLTGINDNSNITLSIILATVFTVIILVVEYFGLKTFVFRKLPVFSLREMLTMIGINLLTGFVVVIVGGLTVFIVGLVTGMLGLKTFMFLIIGLLGILIIPCAFRLHYFLMRLTFGILSF